MPPPMGVVRGPLMPTRYFLKSVMVSSGSQLPVLLKAFSPARTSCQWIFFLPLDAFWTAASKTRTEARQMSGPVPSPSMNGMMGWSGTLSLPAEMVTDLPWGGTVTFLNAVAMGFLRVGRGGKGMGKGDGRQRAGRQWDRMGQ